MSKLVIVDIWAEWCGPCKKFAPIFESLKEKYLEHEFIKVDADKEDSQAVLQKFSVRGIPTILIIRDNELVFSHAGILSQAAMESVIATYAPEPVAECEHQWEPEQGVFNVSGRAVVISSDKEVCSHCGSKQKMDL